VTEYRRILLDGAVVQTVREGETLVAADGRRVAIEDAHHLPPAEPTKIIAVHLNYDEASGSTHVFSEAPHRHQQPQRCRRAPGGLQMVELRG
jgi:hypothetical protein